jgi:hypothetical protein
VDSLRTVGTVDLFPRAILGLLCLVVHNFGRSTTGTCKEEVTSRQVDTMPLPRENPRVISDIVREENQQIVPIGYLLVDHVGWLEAVFAYEMGIVKLQGVSTVVVEICVKVL